MVSSAAEPANFAACSPALRSRRGQPCMMIIARVTSICGLVQSLDVAIGTSTSPEETDMLIRACCTTGTGVNTSSRSVAIAGVPAAHSIKINAVPCRAFRISVAVRNQNPLNPQLTQDVCTMRISLLHCKHSICEFCDFN